MSTLGERVKLRREQLQLRQAELCDLVNSLSPSTPLNQQNLSALENRRSRTSEHAYWLALALQVSLRWLVAGVGNPDEREWPFPFVAQSSWDACDDAAKGYVQGAMNRALAEVLDKAPERHELGGEGADTAKQKRHRAG